MTRPDLKPLALSHDHPPGKYFIAGARESVSDLMCDGVMTGHTELAPAPGVIDYPGGLRVLVFYSRSSLNEIKNAVRAAYPSTHPSFGSNLAIDHYAESL